MLGTQTTTFWWLWSLTLDEVEMIERDRGPNAAAETLSFNLEVTGIATVEQRPWASAVRSSSRSRPRTGSRSCACSAT